jgi:hypothetical protein
MYVQKMTPHILRSPYRRLLDELIRDIGVGIKLKTWNFESSRATAKKAWAFTKCSFTGHDYKMPESYEKYVDKALAAKTSVEFELYYSQAEALARFKHCTKCQQYRRVAQ